MKKDLKRCIGLGVVAFAVFLLIYYWEQISGIGSVLLYAITPLVGGIIIAYIVNIPMSFYERMLFTRINNKFTKLIKRPFCMLLSFATVAAVVVAVVVLILPELTECLNLIIVEVPPFIQNVYAELEAKYEISSFISDKVMTQFSDIKDVTDIVSRVVEWFFNGFGNVLGSLFLVVSTVFSAVFSVFMSFVFAVYLLAGKERLFSGIGKVVKAYFKKSVVSKLERFVQVADQSFHRFIVGQCTEAIILGLLCIIGMNIFKFPYATMIGTLVGFTALVPIAGAYIGAAVGAMMILNASNWINALLFVVFIIVLQQLEGNLIYPRVVGASIGLPGIWVLATVTVAGSLGGIPAMLVGVPLVATVYRLVRGDVRNKLDKYSENDPDDVAHVEDVGVQIDGESANPGTNGKDGAAERTGSVKEVDGAVNSDTASDEHIKEE